MPDTTLNHLYALKQINTKFVASGEDLPSVRLKSGEKVQTDTVAAILVNIGKYNAGEKGQIKKDLKMAIPTLIKIGLFQLFPPEQWASKNNPGRTMVGEKEKAFIANL